MLSDLLLASILAASTPQQLEAVLDQPFDVEYDRKVYTVKSKQDIIPNGFTDCYEVKGTRQNYCFYDSKFLDTVVVKLNSEEEYLVLKNKVDENLPYWINNRGQRRWVTQAGKIVLFNYPYFLITVN